MKILIVGEGGREHALAWKLTHDSRKPELFCASGNAGCAELATILDISSSDIDGLLSWAKEARPDLTVVGPEVPLCAGIVDVFEKEGLRVFGPSKAASQLEGSKLFAKEVMQAAGVPAADSRSFSDYQEALEYLESVEFPVVVKADGLAAGKGVTICETLSQAKTAVHEAMVDKTFGDAGTQVLIEDCLVGEEASILAMIDGKNVVMLASSQDHKRVFNNDEGPNTGGMGAYSPAPVVTDELWPVIREQVFERMLTELNKRGITYKGILYAGVMVTEAGPKVLEFNCRFGDPETQAILPRIEGDLIPALEACIDGTLTDDLLKWRSDSCVCVVMASGGYPGSYEKGMTINGISEAQDLDGVVIFHAGTKLDGETVVTSGGRVLGVTAMGETLQGNVKQAYLAILKIKFDQAQYRTDIAAKALR
jgi:phosphoribosylamine--glycine ligase